MTMQRRHFELIARTIACYLDGQARRDAAAAFATELAATNKNFDPLRFLNACNVSTGH